jgi:predicted TPR repeat methyltransferase
LSGRIRIAESLYRQVIDAMPNHADALHLLGLANHQLGNNDLAYTLINQAISVNSRDAAYFNNLGEVCRALHRIDEALSNYEKALERQPLFPEAHRNIGLAYLEKGDSDLAISWLKNAAERFPDYLGAHFALGIAYQRQSRFDEAIASLDRGLAINPVDPALITSKGIALRAKGDLDAAVQHYKEAIASQPDMAEYHNNLALVYQQLGNSREAIACFQKVLELRPGNESARHMLAALQNTTTERAPAAYIRETFDNYAENFEKHLGKLEYHTPSVLMEMIRNELTARDNALRVLDLGCGTGLFGEQIQPLKRRLVGIDLSTKMLDKARERGIYDELIEGDLIEFMSAMVPGNFDLIAAADVFNYLGNLESIFEQASRILPRGGWLLFSVEAHPEAGRSYLLSKTGRYQHGRPYIERLARQTGFVEVSYAQTYLRKEADSPVEGHLFLLRKTGPT